MAGATTYWWRDPETGELVAVGADGTPLASPPALAALEGQALSSYMSAMNLGPEDVSGKTVVVDQWGNPIEPLYPELDVGGLQPDGTWTPTSLPEGVRPPEVAWWQDPETGKVVAVGTDGTPLASPPALTVLAGESRDTYLTAMEIDPTEVSGKTLVVDQFGRLVESLYPEVDSVLFGETGALLQVSPLEGFTPPDMAWWQDPKTGKLVAVGTDGTPLASPPALTVLEGESRDAYLTAMEIDPTEVSGKTLVVDQFGRLVDPLWPEGDFGFDENGLSTFDEQALPEGVPEVEWTKVGHDPRPPAMFYWQDPETGKLVAVDTTGTPLVSPPALMALTDQHLKSFGSRTGPLPARFRTVETIVVDQWGRVVEPLYWEDPDRSDFGFHPETGMYEGPSTPPSQADMTYENEDFLGYVTAGDVSVRWWRDPHTGSLVAVDEDGDLVPCPPGLKVLEGDSLSAYLSAFDLGPEVFHGSTVVLDQWGNRVEPLYPEGDFAPFDETGAPKPVTLPDGFQPPEVLYWQDPETGTMVAVDSEGQPMTTPPALHVLTPDQASASGLSGPGPHVMDQFGRIVLPINPAGDFGFDDEGVYTPPEPVADAGLEEEEDAGEVDEAGGGSTEGLETEAAEEEPGVEQESPPEEPNGGGDQGGGSFAEEGDDAGRRYVGVDMAEGEVLLDADANEPSGDSRGEARAETGDEESEGVETVEVGTVLGLGATAFDQVISAGDDRVRTEARQIRVPELPTDRTLAHTIEEGSAVDSAVEETTPPGEEVEVIPITVPMPPPPEEVGEAVEGDRAGGEAPGEEVEVIPITVPMPPPPEEVGEVSMDYQPPPDPEPPSRAQEIHVPVEDVTDIGRSSPEGGAVIEGADDASLPLEISPIEEVALEIQTGAIEGLDEIEDEASELET